ncbi:MAG: response regulator [Anaerolineae bacterium]|jgi:pilus assembly protein CpaE
MEEIKVLVVDDVAETRENLRKLLSFEPDIDVVGAAGSGPEGIELAKQVDPHVVLMDINMPGMDGITATEQLLQTVPTAAVVMLSVQGESDYLRRAMLAGARDYLTKPASADELVNTIHRVFEMAKSQRERRVARIGGNGKGAEQGASRRGDVVVVFGPKGGAGCTTIAINTAIVLQELFGSERRVALLDGNLQFGDVGVMLDLRPDRSIADLADRIDELDSDLLSSVMSAHGSGIKVLLAPPRPEAAESLLTGGSEEETSKGAVGAVLDKMRERFDVIVADTWSRVDDITLTLLDAATVIVVVLTPDIPAVKSTRLFLELARKLNYDTEKVLLVLNRSDHRGRLQVSQIEKAMMPVTAEIPFDEDSALTAANRGVPVVQRDRTRPMSESIVDLTKIIHGRLSDGEEESSAEPRAEPRGIGGTGLLRLRKALRGS